MVVELNPCDLKYWLKRSLKLTLKVTASKVISVILSNPTRLCEILTIIIKASIFPHISNNWVSRSSQNTRVGCFATVTLLINHKRQHADQTPSTPNHRIHQTYITPQQPPTTDKSIRRRETVYYARPQRHPAVLRKRHEESNDNRTLERPREWKGALNCVQRLWVCRRHRRSSPLHDPTRRE